MKNPPLLISGFFNPRILFAFALCSVGVLLAMLSFAAPTAQAQLPNGSFTAVGSMSSLRHFHTATLLGNGKVLIAGGFTAASSGITNTAELFDPAAGTWTSVSNTMSSARAQHTATLLPSGKVLLAGGHTGNATTNTAELFDPASATFTSLPPMDSARHSHTATLLSNGKVLIAGGYTGSGFTNTAELFDPTSGTFTSLSPNTMTSAHYQHTATLLPNGKVLIAGGGNTTSDSNSTAELFDPSSGTFTGLAPMAITRTRHVAMLLPTGKVLIAGGYDGNVTTDTAEVFDPAVGSFTPLPPMTSPRQLDTATLLPSGKVLLAGGYTSGPVSNTGELFDPVTGTFMPLSPNNMTSARAEYTATLLPGGKVLIAGGDTGASPLGSGTTNTAELFDYAAGSFTSTSSLHTARYNTAATLLPSGDVLISGGASQQAILNTAELFDSSSGAFVVLPNTMNSPRFIHSATLLGNGKVLIAGGYTNQPSNTGELFDPASGTFVPIASTMATPRYWHTATLLPNGKVLIAGGYDGSGATSAADLFDPASAAFVSLPPMNFARHAHSATLLENGKVLIAGGYTRNGATNTAELFDPVSETFTLLSPNTMSTARFYHTATLLPNGKVLLTGGSTGAGFSNTAEVFDPVSQTFAALSNTMNRSRYWHTATQLPSGKILIVGGYTDVGFFLVITNTAELFDPASETFTLVPSTMSSGRANGNTVTLVTNGEVLVAAGLDGNTIAAEIANNTADLFNEGLGFSDARRPVISTAPSSLTQPASLVLAGTSFRGDSEGSGGAFNSSATNYPLLQLTRIDNEQSFFVESDPQANWSDTTFSSAVLGAVTPLPTGYYRATIFTNAIPSLQKIINIGAPPLQLVGAVSRKTHGSAGTFDVNLPFSFNLPIPPPGIECRAGGGTGGDHTLVFTFNNIPVSGSATVASGTGSVLGSPTFAGHEMRVNLTGVANAQQIGVTLNVTDSFGQSFVNPEGIPVGMGVLLGDTSANRLVNSTDVSQTQAQSGQAVTKDNFRADVNANGLINSTDVSIVQSKSGTGLP